MNKIENLFNSGVKKIYICEFCGDIGSTDHLMFRGKMSECCPECGKAFFKVYDWLDYILEMDNINKSKSRSESSKSLYSRRSKVKLILNKIIIEKIKDGKATKNIKCPMCKGKGHNGIFLENNMSRGFIQCGKCKGKGIVQVNKDNYKEFIE